jgi:hypothetical protein
MKGPKPANTYNHKDNGSGVSAVPMQARVCTGNPPSLNFTWVTAED